MTELFSQLGFWAVVDILVMTLIIYRLLLLIRGTRAMQMVFGILILVGITFLVSEIYPLTTLKWLMDRFYSSIIIVIVILFQEDIRRVLSRVGTRSLMGSQESISSKQILDEITRASMSLASKRIGALIVLERNIILSRYVDVGILLDSRISKEILLSIFHPTSPIHDGAVIVQQGRIAAAGCFLPLTRDNNVDSNFGTRHRAAIGISQESDSLVVVVSEENAAISLIADGHVSRDLDPKELRKALRNFMSSEADEPAVTKQKSNPMIERMKIFKPRGFR